MNQTKNQKRLKPKHNFIPRFVREYTAGGVIVRRRRNLIEILMIQDRQGRWTIPKGHVEKGEKLEETAIREVEEETGLDKLKIITRLDKIHFFYRRDGRLIFMTTYVFLMEALGNSDELHPEPNEGIADVRWFDGDQAIKTVEYKDTEKLFKIGLKKFRYG